jgi:hypothetical protein
MGLDGNWGPLRFFFESKYNITYNLNGTPTNFTQTLDTCAASYIWTSLATLALLLLLAYLLFPLIIDLLNALWIFLQKILVIPPFSFLLVWPLTYIVNPDDAGGWSSDGSYNYWDGSGGGGGERGGGGGGGKGGKKGREKKKKKKDDKKDGKKKKKSNSKSKFKSKSKTKTKKRIKSSISTNINDVTEDDESVERSSSSSSASDSDYDIYYSYEECSDQEDDDLDYYVFRENPEIKKYFGFSGTVRYLVDGLHKFYKEKRRQRSKSESKKNK